MSLRAKSLPFDHQKNLYGAPRVRNGVMLCVLILILILLSVILGSKEASWNQLFQALQGESNEAFLIMTYLRMPRTALGLMVGLCLGIAGALIQGLTKNPVADPVVLGIAAGAGLGIAAAAFVLHITTMMATVWFGLLGAIIAAAFIMLIGRRIGARMSGLAVILGGVAVQAGFTAVTSALLIYDEQSLGAYRLWTVGSLAGRPTELFLPLGLFMLVGLGLASYSAVKLNILTLGEEVATSMGEHVRRLQLIGFLAVAVLTTVAVAAAGPIAFLGLLCAHLATVLAGGDWRWLTAYAGAIGIIVLLSGDILGRLLIRPAELPAGIVIALFGAPYFIFIIKRSKVKLG